MIFHQFQVKLTSTSPQNQQGSDDDNDDIDSALSDLQVSVLLYSAKYPYSIEGSQVEFPIPNLNKPVERYTPLPLRIANGVWMFLGIVDLLGYT